MKLQVTYHSGRTDTLTAEAYSADLMDALAMMSRHEGVLHIEATIGESSPVLIQDGGIFE